MSEPVWDLLTLAGMASVGLMGLVWLFARVINNAGVVDVAWSLGFAVLAGMYYAVGQGDPTRKLLISGMVVVWSLRLGIHLWMRVAKDHPEEDGRYASLREQFPTHTWLMFLGFFELQAVLLVLLSVPFAMAASNLKVGLSPIEWAGAGLWLVAMLGEAIADWQLRVFKARPDSRGRTCRIGLWRYSRHPNYFFEWLVWVAYFVFALGTEGGWITIYCPALMLFFLFKVTGIPTTEAQALKSRGDDYRDYQRTTSVFVPWWPRNENHQDTKAPR